MRISSIFMAMLLLVAGCSGERPSMDQAKDDLLQVDRKFSEMSVADGPLKAFNAFMATNATVFHDGAMPFTGRDEIDQLYTDWPGGTLQWEPYFADVSSGGDMGYTLGQWEYVPPDSTASGQGASGYYVTIWKLQSDGTWKFVFDTGTQRSPDEEE